MTHTFTLDIDCDNDAFGANDANRALELGALLRTTADRLTAGIYSGSIRDSNGNRVGLFHLGGHVDRPFTNAHRMRQWKGQP